MRNIRLCYSDYASFLETERQLFQKKLKSKVSSEEITKWRPEFLYNNFVNYFNCVRYEYAVGDMWVEGFLISAKKSKKSKKKSLKRSTIIYNRGGNGNYGRITFKSITDIQLPLAAKGFIVLSSQYREKDEFGGKDVFDVLELIEINKQIKNADPEKLGMYGWSRGGMMTYMAARNNSAIKTIVIGAGVVDMGKELKWRPEMERVYEYRIPNYKTQKKQEFEKRSVIDWADELPKNMPILLLHETQISG
jgi:dipeptidyl aminopeptidase/acylaminoacyl peptidase